MPTDNPQSQSHRPSLAGHRSNSSIHSQQTDSPSSTPPQHGKVKHQKHVVGGHHHHAPRMHARVPSSKSMHTVTAASSKRAAGGSTDNLKKLGRNASATNVRRNASHVSLKRNQSSGDVSRNKALKLAAEEKREEGKRREAGAGVHFEIGDQVEGDGEEEEDEEEDDVEDVGEEGDGDGDGWEEASSTASPAISRSASRPNSAKQSAENSQPQSPQNTTFKAPPSTTNPNHNLTVGGHDGTMDKERERRPHPASSTADAKIITERLLQRVPSHNTTKMTLATATPSQSKPTSSSRSHPEHNTPSGPNSNGTSQYGSKEEVISRFVSGSGTPHEAHYLSNRTSSSTSPSKIDDIKRAQSMGNLTRHDSSRLNSEREEDHDNNDSDRPLAPRTRSRKSSTGNAYTPPHTSSRTQQKLMLQRASSNIEPQNLAHPPLSLGISALGLGYAGGGVTGLVGSGIGYDGRDPRIKAQLDRTGLEYLVVRRHQDPIGVAIKRLDRLPGAAKNRKIPGKGKDVVAGRKAGLGLSQSLKDGNSGKRGTAAGGGGGGGETAKVGSYGSDRLGERTTSTGRDDGGAGTGTGPAEDGINSILRSLWDKNFDFGGSAD